MALKTMLEQFGAARKTLDEAKKAITQEMVAQALGEHVPEGRVLVWAQYANYFNDGEPCHFRVRDPMLAEDTGDLKDITSPWADDTGEWADELGTVWDQISDEDLMESLFGNDVLVRVRRGGEFLVTDYTSHD